MEYDKFAKKDKLTARRQARKIKLAQQEMPSMETPDMPMYSDGGTVKGMGSAVKGGKFKLC